MILPPFVSPDRLYGEYGTFYSIYSSLSRRAAPAPQRLLPLNQSSSLLVSFPIYSLLSLSSYVGLARSVSFYIHTGVKCPTRWLRKMHPQGATARVLFYTRSLQKKTWIRGEVFRVGESERQKGGVSPSFLFAHLHSWLLHKQLDTDADTHWKSSNRVIRKKNKQKSWTS